MTYSASSPVTGCRRTTGCTFSTGSRRTIPPLLPERENSACSTPEWTAFRVLRKATNCGDSRFSVETWLVKSVSPPVFGCESKKNVVKPGGCSSYETSECQTVVVTLSSISKLKVDFASLAWCNCHWRNDDINVNQRQCVCNGNKKVSIRLYEEMIDGRLKPYY